MVGQIAGASEVLAALFNNAAFADVAAAAHRIMGPGVEPVPITTRMVASSTGRSDSVVRPVMQRLIRAGLLQPQEEPGSARGPRYLLRENPDRWVALIGLIAEVTGVPADLYDGTTKDR